MSSLSPMSATQPPYPPCQCLRARPIWFPSHPSTYTPAPLVKQTTIPLSLSLALICQISPSIFNYPTLPHLVTLRVPASLGPGTCRSQRPACWSFCADDAQQFQVQQSNRGSPNPPGESVISISLPRAPMKVQRPRLRIHLSGLRLQKQAASGPLCKIYRRLQGPKLSTPALRSISHQGL